jgi:hypothetical protein
MIVYWIFQIAGAKFIQPFSPFFDSIKGFIHLFYTSHIKVDGADIDFAFLMGAFLALFIVWILKFIIEYIKIFEKKFDDMHIFFKNRQEDIFNANLKKIELSDNLKNNNCLVFIKFSLKTKPKNIWGDKESDIDIERKYKEILKSFSNVLNQTFKSPTKIVQDGILFYFNSFNQVEKVISILENRFFELKNYYEKEYLQINYFLAIDVLADKEEILLKFGVLQKLSKLGFEGKMVCISGFKQRYSLIENPKYFIENLGVYKLSDDYEDVFYLSSLKD